MSEDNMIILCAIVQTYLHKHGFTDESIRWLREHAKKCPTCQKLRELIERSMGENGGKDDSS